MGKKSLPWRQDTVILRRLPKVEELHLMHYPNTRIAELLGVDEVTIRRDLKRVRELWRERAGDSIDEQKDKAVAFYALIQQKALGEFARVKDTSLNKSAYLNTAKGAQDSIVKVMGIEAATKLEHTGAGGKPIEAQVTVGFDHEQYARLFTEIAGLLQPEPPPTNGHGPEKSVDSPHSDN